MTKPQIGQSVPLLSVAEWVQGQPTNFDQLLGNVVLVEVFQVNCPGCFLYSLPQALVLHRKFGDLGLSVLAVATAFEDFDKNTLDNLKALLTDGTVVGETRRSLAEHGKLDAGRLPYKIPFPVAMDTLVECSGDICDDDISAYIDDNLPEFDRYQAAYREQAKQQIRHYLEQRLFRAETFEHFRLQGTPSHIVVDRQGLLRACEFGAFADLEALIIELLK